MLKVIAYASVVTMKTVYIALTMAELNDQEVKVADILNSYVMAPNREKILTLLGSEFEDDAGKFGFFCQSVI